MLPCAKSFHQLSAIISIIQQYTAPMMPMTMPAVPRPVFPPLLTACERPTAESATPTNPVRPYSPRNREPKETTKPAILRPLLVFMVSTSFKNIPLPLCSFYRLQNVV